MILPLSHAAANICGFAGAAVFVVAYGYAVVRARPDPLIQHGLNLVGAVLLLASLLVITNAASLVLEVVWALLAGFGVVKAILERTR